jgi:hypothetical protein
MALIDSLAFTAFGQGHLVFWYKACRFQRELSFKSLVGQNSGGRDQQRQKHRYNEFPELSSGITPDCCWECCADACAGGAASRRECWLFTDKCVGMLACRQ